MRTITNFPLHIGELRCEIKVMIYQNRHITLYLTTKCCMTHRISIVHIKLEVFYEATTSVGISRTKDTWLRISTSSNNNTVIFYFRMLQSHVAVWFGEGKVLTLRILVSGHS